MHATHYRFGVGIAGLIAGTLSIVPALEVDAYKGPTADNHNAGLPLNFPLPCPAIDTEPVCALVHQRNSSDSDGSRATRPQTVSTTVSSANSDCVPPDGSHTAGDGAGCARAGATHRDNIECTARPWLLVLACPD